MEVVSVIGQKDGSSQQSATRSYVAREADIFAEDVTLKATANTTVEADASSFAAAGLVAATSTEITAKGAHDTEVYVDDMTDMTLTGDLDMRADGTTNANPQSKNTSIAGAVAFETTTIRTELDSDTVAYIGKQGVISADSIKLEAKAVHNAHAASLSTALSGLIGVSLLDVQVEDKGGAEIRIGSNAPDASPGTTMITTTIGGIDLDADLTSNVSATTDSRSLSGLGNFSGADTSAENNSTVKGRIGEGVQVDSASFFDMQASLLGYSDASATSINASGFASISSSDTVSTFNGDVEITTGGNGSIHAGTDVTVLGLLNYDQQNETFYRYTDGYGAFGSADATSVSGVASVDEAVINVNNNSDVDVSVGEGTSLTAGQDVNVAARHSAESFAAGNSSGFAGIIRASDITANVNTNSSTTLSFLGDVGDGVTSGAENINFDAVALAATTSGMTSGGGSLFGSFAGGDANSTTLHTVNATFGGDGSTMKVEGNIRGKAYLLSDADAAASANSFSGFADAISVGTNAAATGTVNFNVGDTAHVEAGELIELIAEQGGEGSDISDGTIVDSDDGTNTVNFGAQHKLIDNNTVTFTGTTYGGLVNGKEYSVVVFNDEEIQLGSNFASSQVSTSFDTITIPNHAFVNGDEVIYNSNGGTPINGLSNSTKYQVKVVDENTIKLQTLGFVEETLTFDRGDVDATNEWIDDAGDVFDNGDVVTYHTADPRSFISTFVDASITLDDPATEADEFNTSQDGSNVGRIYVPGHGFSNGQAVVYNALDGVNVPGLIHGQTYYVINGGSFKGGEPIGEAYFFNANFIRLALTFADTQGFIDDNGTVDDGDPDTDDTADDFYVPPQVIDLSYTDDGSANAFKGHSLIGVGEQTILNLTPGRAYYVTQHDGTKFKLATNSDGTGIVNLNLAGNAASGNHKLVREGIDFQSSGPSSGQTLVFDLTENDISGTFSGVGGAARGAGAGLVSARGSVCVGGATGRCSSRCG